MSLKHFSLKQLPLKQLSLNQWLPLLSVVMLVAGCSEPLGVFPGGSLSGEMRQAPLEWMGAPETIQLETNPEDPYSINIWAVDIGDKLYIATGEDGTTWSEHIERDPNVRARVDGIVYELVATRVTDPVEHADVLDMYIQKYDVDVEGSWVETGMIFRLD